MEADHIGFADQGFKRHMARAQIGGALAFALDHLHPESLGQPGHALADALRAGHIGGAGFDVLTEEPPRDNPLLAPDILALGNFILTPHVAWSSGKAMQALADQVTQNIEAFIDGQPRNNLNDMA